MGDNEYYAIVILAIGIVIVGIVGLCQLHHTRRCKMFIEAGYTRATLPGEMMTQWVKP